MITFPPDKVAKLTDTGIESDGFGIQTFPELLIL